MGKGELECFLLKTDVSLETPVALDAFSPLSRLKENKLGGEVANRGVGFKLGDK